MSLPENKEPTVSKHASDCYSSDRPIKSKADDLFHRSKFATRIADTLAKRNDPSSIVLGIYGTWGSGKTSVLSMMTEHLKDSQNVVTVSFNPWIFKSEELLLRGFFDTLAASLSCSLSSDKEKIGKLLKDYGDCFSEIPLPVNLGKLVKNIGKKLSSVNLEKLKQRIEKFLEDNKKRVVIFIDDIDRLDRTETHAIFKLVKLSADFNYTAYVMAFDYDVVSAALGERYGHGGQEAGKAFLEKIIQVPLFLPPANPESLRQLTFNGVEEVLAQAEISLDETEAQTFGYHIKHSFSDKLTTPRLAKLYVNALMFALPLLKGEVDPVDLMLIEGVRVFYPGVYMAVRDNAEYFLNGDTSRNQKSMVQNPPRKIVAILEKAMPTALEDERNRVEDLLIPLFPRIQGGNYGGAWEDDCAKKKKICSKHYFNRYFMYAIPHKDVSDLGVGNFIENICSLDYAEQEQTIEDIASRQAMPRFIDKLRLCTESLSEEQAIALIELISAKSSLLPDERDSWAYSTASQAAILISKLLLRVENAEKRQSIANAVVLKSEALSFAVQCFTRIKHDPESQHSKFILESSKLILESSSESAVGLALAGRISEADDSTPLYRSDPSYAQGLYYWWKEYRGVAEVTNALMQHFQKEPSDLADFLPCFASRGLKSSGNTSVPFVEFRQDNYKEVTKLLDASYIATNLRERFGSELDSPSYRQEESMEPARKIAHQFMYIHQGVLQENTGESLLSPPSSSQSG